MKWEDLNTQNRAELIRLYVKNGVTSLDKMKEHYNSFGEGGNLYPKGGKILTDNLYNKMRRIQVPQSVKLVFDNYRDSGYTFDDVYRENSNLFKNWNDTQLAYARAFYNESKKRRDFKRDLAMVNTPETQKILNPGINPEEIDRQFATAEKNRKAAAKYRQNYYEQKAAEYYLMQNGYSAEDLKNPNIKAHAKELAKNRNYRNTEGAMDYLKLVGGTVAVPAAIIGGAELTPYLPQVINAFGTPFGTTLKGVGKFTPIGKTAKLVANGLDSGLDTYLAGKTIYNTALSDHGVRKTINLINNGNYYNAIKSGAGDVVDIATSIPAFKVVKERKILAPLKNLMLAPYNARQNWKYIHNGEWKALDNELKTAFLQFKKERPEAFHPLNPKKKGWLNNDYNAVGNTYTTIDNKNAHYIFGNNGKWYNPFSWDWELIRHYGAYNTPLSPYDNEIKINPLSKILTPEEFKGLMAHELRHSYDRKLSNQFKLSEWEDGYDYWVPNKQNPLYDHLKPFEKKRGTGLLEHKEEGKGDWVGSPEELGAEMANWKKQAGIKQNTKWIELEQAKKDDILNKASERFYLDKKEMNEILTPLSSFGYFKYGGPLF